MQLFALYWYSKHDGFLRRSLCSILCCVCCPPNGTEEQAEADSIFGDIGPFGSWGFVILDAYVYVRLDFMKFVVSEKDFLDFLVRLPARFCSTSTTMVSFPSTP